MGNFRGNNKFGGDRGGKRFGDKGSFGGKRFGGNNSFDKKRDSFGGAPRLFDATCSKCGDPCRVPFQPSGTRPVFCSFCFDKQNEGGESRGGRSDRDGFRPNRFEDRAPKQFGGAPTGNTSNNDIEFLKKQIAELHRKMDSLLATFAEIASEDEDNLEDEYAMEDDEEITEEKPAEKKAKKKKKA